MGQKTHPIGFRLQVPTITESTPFSYGNIDLHGYNSRWAVNNITNKSNYSDLAKRDVQIKTIIEQFLEEDGYIRNKCIITRSQNYVGIYVDALELEESTLSTISSTATDNSSKTTNAKSMNVLEGYLSRTIEFNTPVHIQFVLLEPRKEFQEMLTETLRSDIDLYKALIRLFKEKTPCCKLIAKITSLMRSGGGRRERETRRLIRKLMSQLYKNNTKDKGDNINLTKEYGVKGYLMIFKGRIGGSERSRIIRYRSGPRPRHTVSAAIDQGFAEVNTVSGKVSVTIRAYFK